MVFQTDTLNKKIYDNRDTYPIPLGGGDIGPGGPPWDGLFMRWDWFGGKTLMSKSDGIFFTC